MRAPGRSAAGAEVHIVGADEGLTSLPEFAHLRGVPGGLTPHEGPATLDESSRGQGGLHCSVGEENLLRMESDPRYPGRDILWYERVHHARARARAASAS